MTVVIGTAGHIDHGKTALLQALTGIDADRLPEEQRRGMTIDVGYAHAMLPDGEAIDFVDVPGHDRLIGNMLVGAGEIDAAMLVVAADDGPRAQTLEHLELLDALGIVDGLAVVTKSDLVDAARLAAVTDDVRRLLERTTLAGRPIVAVSSITGVGVEDVRGALLALRDRLRAAGASAGGQATRLAVDRAFAVKGRGLVVTGTLRGGPVAAGDMLRLEPGRRSVRVREVQVHGRTVPSVDGGGRVALNLAGVQADSVERGLVAAAGPAVEVTSRLLAVMRPAVRLGGEGLRDRSALRHGLRVRVHLGTEQVDATLDLGRRAAAALAGGRTTAIVRLDRPIATAFSDAFVVRRPSPGETLAGGRVLDPRPPHGVSRRRITALALVRLATAASGSEGQLAALVGLHGALPVERVEAWAAATGGLLPDPVVGGVLLDAEIGAGLRASVVEAVGSGDASLAEVRTALVADLRRRVSLERDRATAVVDVAIDEVVTTGEVVRASDRLRPQGSAAGPSTVLVAAMDRLASALAVPAPPALSAAAQTAGCSLDGIRALEAAGRIVRVEDDLAWEAATFRRFEALAVRMAATGPLAPAAYRDATGTSRRFALAILEDLDRRGVLRRTPAGHVPGPRAATAGFPA